MHEIAQTLLERDPLRNVLALQRLATHPEAAHCLVVESAVLVLLPARVSPFDRRTYPGMETIAMLAGENPQDLQALLPGIPRGSPLLFKLNHPAQRAAAVSAFPLRRAMAFVCCTAPEGSCFLPVPGVITTRRPDENCLALFAGNGYDREEVEDYFTNADACAFAVYVDGRPVSACLAYRNYGPIYEIGALHTLPQERRKGYARQVVLAALAWVVGNGLVPRYVASEHNEVSLQLAESIGLSRYIVTEHWVSETAQV